MSELTAAVKTTAFDLKLKNNSVISAREMTATSFDRANEEAVSVSLGDIEIVRYTLIQAALKSEPKTLDPWFHGVALLNRAQETLVSSIYLARHRMCGDAFSLLRVAVETAAVAVHVTTDRVAFERYVGTSGKTYDAPKAIGVVRSLMPRLPEVWGTLSQAAIHPNVRTFGPSAEGGHRVIHIPRRDVDTTQDRLSLRGVSLVAALVLQAAELVLFEEISTQPGWLQLRGSSMRATATAGRLVEKRYRQFTSREPVAAQQAAAVPLID